MSPHVNADRRWYKACAVEGCHGADSDQRCRVPHHHHGSASACDCLEGGEPGTKVGG